MIRWRRGVVLAVGREWPGAVELHVQVDGAALRALAYPRLTGRPGPGEDVLLNTGALDLGLGTGGYALVVAVPDRLPADSGGPGHLVKARYTPMQAIVPGAEEQGSPYYELLRDADDLGGMPVVVADLHSALPAILAGYYAERPLAVSPAETDPTATGSSPTGSAPTDSAPADSAPADSAQPGPAEKAGRAQPGPATRPGGTRARRVVYVMLDGGALPAWFSRTAALLREAGWLAGTITAGQAFGGDLETVTLHSGLLAARHALGAELVVVCQGPGNLGTGTRWGFSGVACGEAVNAAAVLGGRPVACLRVSDADSRDRHRGISHHSLTAYGRVALARADVVVPDLPGELGALVASQAEPLGQRHDLITISVAGLAEALAACPVPLSTMGRGLDADLGYFLTAAAAGRHAAGLVQA